MNLLTTGELTVLPTVPCPSCSAPLPPVRDCCPACGLSLTGAVELWEVDQWLAALRRRRGILLTQLEGRPRAVVGSPPVPPRVVAGRAPHGGRGWPAQQVLLSVGALLIFLAASVFLAVAWEVLGVGGQVAVMGVVTVIAGGSSVVLARRGLRASAEVVAVLTVALALADAAAARWLGLAGSSRVDGWGYAAWVSAGLALVLVTVSPPVLKQTAVTYRLVAVLAGAAAPLLGLVGAQERGVGAVVVSAAVAMIAGVGSRRLTAGWAGYRGLLTPVFGGYLALTWLLALRAGVHEPLLVGSGASLAVAVVVAVGAGWAAGLHHGLRRAVETHPVLSVATLLGGTSQLVAAATQCGLVWVAVLAVAGAAVPAVVAGTAADLRAARRGVVAAAAQVVSVGALLVLAVTPLDPTAGPAWVVLATAYGG
ncbi:MAG TPA: hypothetical protein VGC37_06680, partial [Friedmanniella sp.]